MENLPVKSEHKSLFLDIEMFEHAQRVGKVFAAATMVPDQFRNNSGNCLIAMNYANRIEADMFMVMQSMHVIHGKPGVEGKLVAALINQSGKYKEPLKYQWLDPEDNEIPNHLVVNNSEKDYRGCRAYTVDAKSDQTVYGPKISWHIVHSEGWYGKSGSKWKTIPELMFMYRAASWFANVHCPEVKLGMQTVEELKDIVELRQTTNGSYSTADSLTMAIQDNAETFDPQKNAPSALGSAIDKAASEEQNKKYACPWPDCNFKTETERGYKSHITRSHDGKEPEPIEPIDTFKDGNRPYTCMECGMTGTVEDLNSHKCPKGVEESQEQKSEQSEKLAKDLIRQIKEFDSEVKDEAFKRLGLAGSADLDRYPIGTLDELLDRCFVVQNELKM